MESDSTGTTSYWTLDYRDQIVATRELSHGPNREYTPLPPRCTIYEHINAWISVNITHKLLSIFSRKNWSLNWCAGAKEAIVLVYWCNTARTACFHSRENHRCFNELGESFKAIISTTVYWDTVRERVFRNSARGRVHVRSRFDHVNPRSDNRHASRFNGAGVLLGSRLQKAALDRVFQPMGSWFLLWVHLYRRFCACQMANE
jgi:hypothetical protein